MAHISPLPPVLTLLSGGPELPELPRDGCQSYGSGHHVHRIPAPHTANKPEVYAKSWRGRLTDLDGEVPPLWNNRGKRAFRFRNHDLERPAAVVDWLGGAVPINHHRAILRAGSYCFSIAFDEGARRGVGPTDVLPVGASDAQLAERTTNAHGGFQVDVHEPRDGVQR